MTSCRATPSRCCAVVLTAAVVAVAVAQEPSRTTPQRVLSARSSAPKKPSLPRGMTPAEYEEMIRAVELLKNLEFFRYADVLADMDTAKELSTVPSKLTPSPSPAVTANPKEGSAKR